jgi:hypothetical protein
MSKRWNVIIGWDLFRDTLLPVHRPLNKTVDDMEDNVIPVLM